MYDYNFLKVITVIETIMYYVCMLSIVKRFYLTVPRSRRIRLSFFIFVPFTGASVIYDMDTLLLIHILIQCIELVIIKISFENISFKNIIYTYTLLFAFNSLIISVILYLFSVPEKFDLHIDLLINLFVSIGIIAMCYTKLSYKIQNIITLTPKYVKRLILLFLIAAAMLGALLEDRAYYPNKSSWDFYVHLAVSIIIIFVCVAFPIFILNSITNSEMKKLIKSYEEQMLAQANYYITISQSNFELRRFRHDYKNLEIGICRLLEDGKNEDAICILKQGSNILSQAKLQFDTGDNIVNALLSDKNKKAVNINSEIIFSGAVPENIFSPIDLCVIFGVTTDNALEACEKISIEIKKEIQINCNCSSGFMFLTITNPVLQKIKIHNNIIATDKTDKSLHGFGLYSLNQVVKKYSGKCNLDCSDDIFCVKIELNL